MLRLVGSNLSRYNKKPTQQSATIPMSENTQVECSRRVDKVAIIGAGLDGLAAAMALRKQGIDAQVYEKARELRPVGVGLTLFPNGLNSLDAIEPAIVESVKRAGS